MEHRDTVVWFLFGICTCLILQYGLAAVPDYGHVEDNVDDEHDGGIAAVDDMNGVINLHPEEAEGGPRPEIVRQVAEIRCERCHLLPVSRAELPSCGFVCGDCVAENSTGLRCDLVVCSSAVEVAGARADGPVRFRCLHCRIRQPDCMVLRCRHGVCKECVAQAQGRCPLCNVPMGPSFWYYPRFDDQH